MSAVFTLASLPVFALLFSAFLTKRRANRHPKLLRIWLSRLAAVNAIAAVASLIGALILGPMHLSMVEFGANSPLAVSLFLDGTSALMWVLVGFVGWVICRFSVRYLDGEKDQGRYFCWTAFTIGAVSLAVISGNLLLMILSLLLTSIGLHQSLVHYADRPAARRAAAIKFFFSRLGDLCLLVAAFLLFREFGTLELPALFALVAQAGDSPARVSESLTVVGWMLALCAVFKSAQFPFHTWLPETMEAPTPVSALMHAGIVNAGGYLLIRMSPILTLAPSAMWAVAGLGAFTALIAALAMLSQTSIKRSLAWSTIAQMGFMMLQCGLGAFSAAMLHILAHSLYKAHAFLASGSVMSERFAMATPAAKDRSTIHSLATFCASAAVSLVLFLSLATAFDFSLDSKPGGYLLGFILCLGMTRWLWKLFQQGRQFLLPGVAITSVLITVYLGSFAAVDAMVATSNVSFDMLSSNGLLLAVAAAFAAMFVLETLIATPLTSRWMQRLYVHSSNGFYEDVVWRQVAKSFAS